MLTDILAILSGSIVGFSLSLIGGGGSILATPLLLYVAHVPSVHMAIGTSAFAVSVNAFVNCVIHAKSGNVNWKVAAIFALVGMIGAFIGSTLGKSFDGQNLILLFVILMIVVGISMLAFQKKQKDSPDNIEYDSRVISKIIVVAFFVGILSGFFGIGGGFLIVPGLVFAAKMPMIKAIGTSLFAVGSFGLTTALNYSFSGLIDWKIALEYISGGVIGGFLGMKLAVYLSSYRNILTRLFVAVIFMVAFYILYRSLI